MVIEDYFQWMQAILDSSTIVTSFELNLDRRDALEGFIRGTIKFIDNSTLYLREFISVEGAIARDMYAYQFMDATQVLVFRYDNTGHHNWTGSKHPGRNAVAPTCPDQNGWGDAGFSVPTDQSCKGEATFRVGFKDELYKLSMNKAGLVV